jgi:hypothetical protein
VGRCRVELRLREYVHRVRSCAIQRINMAKHSSLHAEPYDEKAKLQFRAVPFPHSIFIPTNPHPSRPRLRSHASRPESSCKAYREDPVLCDVGKTDVLGWGFFGVGGPV